MRYTETRERSAELLRLALTRMGQHDANFNPISFTLWYEHAAGFNPKLNQAVDAIVNAGRRLDNAAIARLYQDHIAQADEATMRRISGDFQRVMEDIAETATLTGDRAGVFGEQLDGLSQALQSHHLPELSPQLTQALAGTAEMKVSAEALQQQVLSGRDEIERLRSDLNTARHEALLDPLARVLNRKGFDLKLAALIARPAPPGTSHCLVMLDIDHFKKVNDQHGHVMGDRVIRGLGEILRACVSDETHSVARYGGEEFAILLPETSLDDGARLAEAVRSRTKAMKIRNRNTQEVMFTVTLSGGVAAMQPGDDAQRFIARADRALYRAKQSGRDRVDRAV